MLTNSKDFIKAKYDIEVAEQLRHDAEKYKLEADEILARLEKAEDVGADKPEHKHYATFKQLKDKWDDLNDKINYNWEEHRKWTQSTAQRMELPYPEELSDKAEEIFK